MKKILTAFLLLALAVPGHAQEKQFRQEQIMGRSWIVLEMDDLKKDTVVNYMRANRYTRYSMDSFVFQICREPVFGNENNNWNLSHGNLLQLGMAMYEIEELNDSIMTIVQPNVLRTKFINEAYMSCLIARPAAIDTFNNKPLYKSSIYLSPHGEGSFLHLTLHHLDKEKAGNYSISFIVTENGELGSIVIDPAFTDKCRKALLQEMKISSGHWTPAVLCGIPVQTLVVYSFRYRGFR
jgi:hypothetical protein